ncbi:MAG: ACP S-malonyltransferase [Proteobacteria bacterium]|nr:ACP S-malonyltransferase [Pseudomonadota bacterium]
MSDSKLLAMFPGQGSQYVGMGKQLLSDFPYLSKTFEEAEDFSKISIRKLCFEGPEDQLKLTANTQPTIVTVSVAAWRALVEEKGQTADFFAGHSLGEYSALVAAGRLAFSDAISLVRNRGLAMQRAVPEGVGAMTAVLSCDVKLLEGYCKDATKEKEPVEIVNYNSPQQLVVAGHAKAVARLEETFVKESVKFIKLQVSAPFHSSMMAPARDEMAPLLSATKFHQTKHPMVPNLTAEVTLEYGPEYLIKQIDSPVKWIQTIENVSRSGVNKYLEIGPGRVLVGLAKRILPKGEWTAEATGS